MLVHQTQNTDKVYPCVHCGSKSSNIIREGADPRLKCNRCNGMFDGSQSLAALEADAIPEEQEGSKEEPNIPPEAASNPRVATENPRDPKPITKAESSRKRLTSSVSSIPRTPSFVLISKNRKTVEYATKKNLKKVVLKWEAQDMNYDLYELKLTQAAVKVEFE